MKRVSFRSHEEGCNRCGWLRMKTRLSAGLLVLLVALTTRAQNHDSRVAQVVTEFDSDADGTADLILRNTYTYDDRNLIRSVSETDLNGDGITDDRSAATFTYNRRGDRILVVGETYSVADNSVESRSTITYTYDRRGRRVGELIQIDRPVDGTVDGVSM